MTESQQKQIPLGPIPATGIRFLDWSHIALCADEHEAILMAWQSRRPRQSIANAADRMGVSKGTLSKYLNGSLGLSPDRQRAFENTVGNRGVTQYIAYTSGFLLTPRELSETEKQAQELQALRARLAELEKVA